MFSRIAAYYHLTKPGIIRGNLLAAVAGFLLASNGRVDWGLLGAVLAGTSLVIAAGCVFNNYIDRDIDRKMARTKQRALVTHMISNRNALIYGTILGALGFAILGLFTNLPTVITGIIGFFFYVVVYGYWKRRSPLGTLVGSIPGATPPVAGYLAVTGHVDAATIILFLMLVCWQMPHFYAIAMFRITDYKAAHIPVLPIVHGMRTTKIHIVAYIAAFTLAASLLTISGYTGFTYLIVMIILGGIWFVRSLQGFSALDDTAWARKSFFFSLLVLLITCIAISTGSLLP